MKSKALREFPLYPSREYGAKIIHAMESGIATRINANVRKYRPDYNLSEGSCVEVRAWSDREGIHPCYVGACRQRPPL